MYSFRLYLFFCQDRSLSQWKGESDHSIQFSFTNFCSATESISWIDSADRIVGGEWLEKAILAEAWARKVTPAPPRRLLFRRRQHRRVVSEAETLRMKFMLTIFTRTSATLVRFGASSSSTIVMCFKFTRSAMFLTFPVLCDLNKIGLLSLLYVRNPYVCRILVYFAFGCINLVSKKRKPWGKYECKSLVVFIYLWICSMVLITVVFGYTHMPHFPMIISLCPTTEVFLST